MKDVLDLILSEAQLKAEFSSAIDNNDNIPLFLIKFLYQLITKYINYYKLL